MARGQTNQANTQYNAASTAANIAGNNANSIYGTLFPTYVGEMEGAATPGSIAANTAAAQSLGGATSGAEGVAAQRAARTRNAGAFAPAADAAVRSGEDQLSTLAAKNKAQTAQEGQAGLGSLFGEENKQQLGQEGQANDAIETALKSGQSGWFQNLLGGINAVANAAKAFRGGGGGGN